jgi:hypothetical protein
LKSLEFLAAKKSNENKALHDLSFIDIDRRGQIGYYIKMEKEIEMTKTPTEIRRLIETNKDALKKAPMNSMLYQMIEDTIERLEVELAVEKIFASLV